MTILGLSVVKLYTRRRAHLVIDRCRERSITLSNPLSESLAGKTFRFLYSIGKIQPPQTLYEAFIDTTDVIQKSCSIVGSHLPLSNELLSVQWKTYIVFHIDCCFSVDPHLTVTSITVIDYAVIYFKALLNMT